MFDFIRRHTKLIMGVLFLLIIPSFVLFGLEGYTRFNDGGTKVATVDGKPITQSEWDNAHRMEVDRLRATNPSLDLSLLDSPALKRASLERLVQERVLAAEVPIALVFNGISHAVMMGSPGDAEDFALGFALGCAGMWLL